jgi:hypothetical protein
MPAQTLNWILALMFWLLPAVFLIWVVVTLLQILNRIAIALEHQAGLEPAAYARMLTPKRHRPPIA